MKKILILTAMLMLTGCSEVLVDDTQSDVVETLEIKLPTKHDEYFVDENGEKIWEGLQALELTFTDVYGNELELSDFLGKPTILNYWASWCSSCNEIMPEFELAYKIYGEDVNFLMLNGLNGEKETEEMALEYWAENEFSMPMYFDINSTGETRPAIPVYDITKYSTTIFIDANGVISVRVDDKDLLKFDDILAQIDKILTK